MPQECPESAPKVPPKCPQSAPKVPQNVKQIELTELIFLYLFDQVHWGHCQIQALVSPLLLLSPVTESFRHDVDDPHKLMLALEKKGNEINVRYNLNRIKRLANKTGYIHATTKLRV